VFVCLPYKNDYGNCSKLTNAIAQSKSAAKFLTVCSGRIVALFAARTTTAAKSCDAKNYHRTFVSSLGLDGN
jgi:hypothetical protein